MNDLFSFFDVWDIFLQRKGTLYIKSHYHCLYQNPLHIHSESELPRVTTWENEIVVAKLQMSYIEKKRRSYNMQVKQSQ